MSLLDDMTANLLSEVAAFKAAPKKKLPPLKNPSIIDDIRFCERTEPGLATIKFPWKDEALVQMMTTTTCKQCGNTGTAWEPYIYLMRTRKVRGKLETHMTRIDTSAYADIYKSYPKRIQVRETSSLSCPHCFQDLTSSEMLQGHLNFKEK